MPQPGQTQPVLPGILEFTMADVTAYEPGLPARTVITVPNPVQFMTTFGLVGLLTGLLHNDRFSVVHHVENLETGARTTLAGGSFTVPAPAAAANIPYASPPYTTGGPGSGANFAIPAGYAAGTFRILTHVHADDPFIRPIVAAFHDGLVIEVIT